MDPRAEAVLQFWFGPDEVPSPEIAQRWFLKDPTFDAEIGRRFGAMMEEAATSKFDGWLAEARSGLALVVLLDQFPRNVFRGSSLAFAHDDKALAASRTLIASGLERALTPHQRMFLYLPFQHAEDRMAQVEGIARYEALLAELQAKAAAPAVIHAIANALDYARQHAELIERFGRFPHRNAVLGRAARPDEESYLAMPGAGF